MQARSDSFIVSVHDFASHSIHLDEGRSIFSVH
jgi:hypothetical protein